MNDIIQEQVFQIPASNFSSFQSKWEKLVRRANKLGITPPSYQITGEQILTSQVKRDVWDEKTGEVLSKLVEVPLLHHCITIQHPEVKVPGGWQFVATLEHSSEGNITHNVSGQDLPAKYRECEPWCDHCQTIRNRKDTFVVKSEQDLYQQVGRNCLAEFLGIDGTDFVNAAEIYYTANELGGASQGGGSSEFDYLEPYLNHVAEVISIEGWLSRTSAKEREVSSTSDIAYRHFHPSPYERHRLYDQPSVKSEEIAKEAIAWCETLSDEEVEQSEYLHNIRVIAKRGIIGRKQYGFAASIVSAYQKSLVDRIKREQRATSQFVGEKGKRQNFIVMVEKVLAFESAYGTTHKHIMRDTAGNVLTWNSSSTVLDIGVLMTIKGTIKSHDDYKGVKQTQLSRCTMVG